MLKLISRTEAFRLLMDKSEYDKVYFKCDDSYYQAHGYRWEFTHNAGNITPEPKINFTSVIFYKEVPDDSIVPDSQE